MAVDMVELTVFNTEFTAVVLIEQILQTFEDNNIFKFLTLKMSRKIIFLHALFQLL